MPSAEISIRPAASTDTVGLARVSVDTWRTAYRGIISDAFLNAMSYERQQQRFVSRPADRYLVVAEHPTAGIVGYAAYGKEIDEDPIYRGQIYAIYVLPEYQGHGIGARLVRQVAGDLTQISLPSMLVWVLAANHPARRFYEALGGTWLGRTKPFRIGEQTLDEVAYGWQDVHCLL